MIVYKKVNGRASDLRFAPEGYELEADEHTLQGNELPDLGTLHDAPTLADVKALKLAEINREFDAAAAQLMAGYPAAERETWPDQKRETLAWEASGRTAATPYIDRLATRRGLDRVDYLTRTLGKVVAFEGAAVALVGDRQKYEDQAKAAATAAAVLAIQPIYSYA